MADSTGSTLTQPHGQLAIEALIEAGSAALDAGATDAGIHTLRRAAEEAPTSSLRARALVALGSAQVHVGRGRDGEGATSLHAAIAAAEEAHDPRILSEASRELGYIEFLRGRYDRAVTWLERAMEVAPGEVDRGSALAVQGAVLCDRGRTLEAVEALAEAASIGRRTDRPRVEGWALALLGRAHLLRRELREATTHLDRSGSICRASAWLSFTPLPQALRAEVHLLDGELDAASDHFDAAFAVGCQIGDPCWEGLGARGIGLVHLARGDVETAFDWLEDAAVRCVRVPDAYLWIHAYCLDTLCEAGARHDRAGVPVWSAELEALAARTGMREMLVRSQLHRSRQGTDAAIEAARLIARDIDNPVVLAQLDAVAVA